MAIQDWSKTYINPNKFDSVSAYKKWFMNGGCKHKALMRLDYVQMYSPPKKTVINGKLQANPEWLRLYKTTQRGQKTISKWKYENREHLIQYDKQKYEDNKDYYIDRSKKWYRKEQARLNTLKNMSWLDYFKEDTHTLNRIKRTYDFESNEQVIEFFTNGKCEICGMTNERHIEVTGTRLHIDHNHKTGERRGLLCSHHNAMIGFAGDDTYLLEKGIEYIKKYEEENDES